LLRFFTAAQTWQKAQLGPSLQPLMPAKNLHGVAQRCGCPAEPVLQASALVISGQRSGSAQENRRSPKASGEGVRSLEDEPAAPEAPWPRAGRLRRFRVERSAIHCEEEVGAGGIANA